MVSRVRDVLKRSWFYYVERPAALKGLKREDNGNPEDRQVANSEEDRKVPKPKQ